MLVGIPTLSTTPLEFLRVAEPIQKEGKIFNVDTESELCSVIKFPNTRNLYSSNRNLIAFLGARISLVTKRMMLL